MEKAQQDAQQNEAKEVKRKTRRHARVRLREEPDVVQAQVGKLEARKAQEMSKFRKQKLQLQEKKLGAEAGLRECSEAAG